MTPHVAGLKWIFIALIVLGVGWTLYYVTQSIQEAERDKVTIELQELQNKKRSTVDAAIKDQRGKTVEEALNYLENRP